MWSTLTLPALSTALWKQVYRNWRFSLSGFAGAMAAMTFIVVEVVDDDLMVSCVLCRGSKDGVRRLNVQEGGCTNK